MQTDNDSVLRRADEIYSPFDPSETKRLRDFVENVEELADSSFFKSIPRRVSISGDTAQGSISTAMAEPPKEAVRAVVPLFRLLFSSKEPTSFSQIMELLGEHVPTAHSDLCDKASHELRGWREAQQQLLQATPVIAMVQQEETVTPEILIRRFLYGRYLHKDEKKSEALDQWPLAHIQEYVFFNLIFQLAKLYWRGRNVVCEVLKHPQLLDVVPEDRGAS